ncbi:MAG: hypothetical protein Q8R70_06425, partial [Methanoregula sp.]|nr:hypothetical protein [Methanoregula sp.]
MAVIPAISNGAREADIPANAHYLPMRFWHLSFIVRVFVLALVSLVMLSGGALAHPPAESAVTY